MAFANAIGLPVRSSTSAALRDDSASRSGDNKRSTSVPLVPGDAWNSIPLCSSSANPRFYFNSISLQIAATRRSVLALRSLSSCLKYGRRTDDLPASTGGRVAANCPRILRTIIARRSTDTKRRDFGRQIDPNRTSLQTFNLDVYQAFSCCN